MCVCKTKRQDICVNYQERQSFVVMDMGTILGGKYCTCTRHTVTPVPVGVKMLLCHGDAGMVLDGKRF